MPIRSPQPRAPRGGRVGAAGAWVLVGSCAAWALVRVLGLERGFPMVPLLAYTPYVAAVALASALLAAALRRWAALGVGAIAVLLFAVAVLPRALGGGADAEGGVELRVMSANLMVGRADAEALVGHVREQGIDLLSVQELTYSAGLALRSAGLERELPHAVLRRSGGSAGSGIYSRLPLEDLASATPAPGGFFMPRAGLETTGGAALEVTAVHVHPPTGSDVLDDWAADMRQLPSAGGEPLRLLLGDFNATLDHAELRDLIDRGYEDAADATGSGLHPTWPDGVLPPPVTIDHLLVDERIAIADYSVEGLPGSDHRVVSAELVLPPG